MTKRYSAGARRAAEAACEYLHGDRNRWESEVWKRRTRDIAKIISEETGDADLLAALEIAAKCIRADHYPGAAETVANAIAKAHGEG